MIPLGHWLRDEASHGPMNSTFPAAEAESEPEYRSGELADLNEDLTRRLAEITDELAAARSELEQQRCVAATREDDIYRQLKQNFSDRLLDEFKSGLDVIRHVMEQSVTDALMPFLERRASERAGRELVALLVQALADSPDPILELRAPVSLHSSLEDTLIQLGITASVTDGSAVEVVFASRIVRMEELSRQWVAALSGEAT